MAMASEGTNRSAVAALPVSGAIRSHAPTTENVILSIHHSTSGVGRINDGGQRDLSRHRRLDESVECVKCRMGAFGSITTQAIGTKALSMSGMHFKADVNSCLQLR